MKTMNTSPILSQLTNVPNLNLNLNKLFLMNLLPLLQKATQSDIDEVHGNDEVSTLDASNDIFELR